MNFPHCILTRSLSSLTIVIAIVVSTPPVQGDEPALRIEDDCVIELVHIEPGKFDMGRSSQGAFASAALSFGEQGDWANAGPVRHVTISRAFSIGKYKITAEQYCRFLNSIDAPEQFVCINRFSNIENRDGKYFPVDGRSAFPINIVHWDGAREFCNWLSKQSGKTVRLPTEAEWEYVARGSAGREAPWGDKSVVNWSSTEGSSVDAFPDNVTPEGVVGLVDYVVGEWCSDLYGVRYNSEDVMDPKGPTVDQLPVKSDIRWLSTVKGAYHVQRGRVRTANWSTTTRTLGYKADNAGICGFRVVAESADP